MKHILTAIGVMGLLAAAGCFTQPPPPPSTERPRGPIDAATREAAAVYRGWYIRSFRELGIIADTAVIIDMLGHSIQDTDDINRLLAPGGEIFGFYEAPYPDFPHHKDRVNEEIAARGIRGLYILCSEARLQRDILLQGYLNGSDLRLGDHRKQIQNSGAALHLFEKTMAIEAAWLDALKTGTPLSEAKRSKVQSYAAFVQELAVTRGLLPPPNAAPMKSVQRAARILERARRIARKLARPVDESDWPHERVARHDAMRSAVQTWILAAEKRFEAENAYAQALNDGGAAPSVQALVWKARYAAYEAFANACAEAARPEWLPLPPAFIVPNEAERAADWRLDPATAALEEARAFAAVWKDGLYPEYAAFCSVEPYRSNKKFQKAMEASMSAWQNPKWHYGGEWKKAVQQWRATLADEHADDDSKKAAAEAALAAQDLYRSIRTPDYWSLVEERYRIPLFMDGEKHSMDIGTAVYEIVVYKIAESMLIALDIEQMYDERVRLGREERAAAGLEQLVAVKEWQAALDGGAAEEEIRIAQHIALSYGVESTILYSESQYIAAPRDLESYQTVDYNARDDWYVPLVFRNDHFELILYKIIPGATEAVIESWRPYNPAYFPANENEGD